MTLKNLVGLYVGWPIMAHKNLVGLYLGRPIMVLKILWAFSWAGPFKLYGPVHVSTYHRHISPIWMSDTCANAELTHVSVSQS